MTSSLTVRRLGALATWLIFSGCGESAPENGNTTTPSMGGRASQGGAAPTMGGSGPMSTGGAAGMTTAGSGGTAGGAGTAGTAGTAGSAGGGGKVTMCAAQTSTAVVPAGTAPMQEAGAAVASTATRPQLTKADADAVHTILEAFRRGGEFTVQKAMGGAAGAAGSSSGGAGGASAGGAAGGGTAGMSTAGGGATSAGASSGGAAGATSGGAAGSPSGGTAGVNAAPATGGAGGTAGASSGGAGGVAGKGGTAGSSAGGGGGAAGATAGGGGTAGTTAGGGGTAGASAGAAGAAGAATAGASGRGTLVFAKNDNWDPLTNGIGDVATFVPTFTVGPGGTHEKLQAAIDEAVFLADCPRVYIRLLAGTHRGVIKIPSKTSAPPLTFYSTESDASKTIIVNNYGASGSPNPGEVIALGVSASATFTNNSLQGMQMKNLTIANDYVEGSVAGDDQSAVALLNQGDRAQFENVRILANRYSLYVKSTSANQSSRSYFRDSYIEGDENIIAGRGTAVFDHCEIKSLGSRVQTGIIATPSTLLNNPHGFLFISSKFTAEAGVMGVLLGRQWYEGSQVEAVGKMIIRNSTIGEHINKASPWGFDANRMTPKEMAVTKPVYSSDDYFTADQAWKPNEIFLGEYGNTGPGATP